MDGKILIADAVSASRITLKVKLETAAHVTAIARCVDEAAHICARALPDAIIASEPLPGGGIVGLRAALAGLPGADSIPIIAVCRPDERMAAIRAGADATVERPLDEFLVLARLRSVLAARIGAEPGAQMAPGLAEPAPQWGASPAAEAGVSRIGLVAGDIATALSWRRVLARKDCFRISAMTAGEALGEAANGKAQDLYLIAADLEQPGEGLRLLSELRSRPASRDAAFVIALDRDRYALAPIALDLGAGDILPLDLMDGSGAEEAVLRLAARLAAKRVADRHRRQAARERLLARADPLTGLANRRGALPRLQQLRALGAVAVMSIDLDHFKSVNDRHGHPAGDAVLVEVAQRLRDILPAEALAARLGGEEFLAAVAADGEEGALAWAEALRHMIASTPIQLPAALGGEAIDITGSVGVVWLPCRASVPTDRLLIDVDRALIRAKTLGRNRVVAIRLRHAA